MRTKRTPEITRLILSSTYYFFFSGEAKVEELLVAAILIDYYICQQWWLFRFVWSQNCGNMITWWALGNSRGIMCACETPSLLTRTSTHADHLISDLCCCRERERSATCRFRAVTLTQLISHEFAQIRLAGSCSLGQLMSCAHLAGFMLQLPNTCTTQKGR